MTKAIRRMISVGLAVVALNAGWALYNAAAAAPQSSSCATGCSCDEASDCTGTGTCVCFPNPFCKDGGACVFASEE
jgi:hypothetical protein